jgi:hypothetical protein
MKRNDKANCELFISFRRLQIHFGIIIISVITLAEINYLHDQKKGLLLVTKKNVGGLTHYPRKTIQKEKKTSQKHMLFGEKKKEKKHLL